MATTAIFILTIASVKIRIGGTRNGRSDSTESAIGDARATHVDHPAFARQGSRSDGQLARQVEAWSQGVNGSQAARPSASVNRAPSASSSEVTYEWM